MKEVTDRLHNEFLQAQIGRNEEVLFETVSNSLYEGYTKNYSLTKVHSDKNLCGKIFNVKITGVKDDYCIGEIENEL